MVNHVTQAARIVFSSKKYVAISVGSFIIFLSLYLLTLPATYTSGRIGIISLRLLTLKLSVFSVVMALLVALIIPFTVYSFKHGGKTRKASAATGFIGSLLPPLLCCSPLLPVLAGVLGAVSPALFGTVSAAQGFIATNETYILLGATILLFIALVQTAKSTKQCIC